MRQQSGRGGRDASTCSQPLGPRGRLRFRPERGSSLSSCYAGMAASRWTDQLKQDTSVFCQQRFSLKSKAKPAYSGTWLQAPDMLLSRKREAGTARAAKRTGPEPAPPRGHPGATRTQPRRDGRNRSQARHGLHTPSGAAARKAVSAQRTVRRGSSVACGRCNKSPQS